jgi:hypothetical protein
MGSAIEATTHRNPHSVDYFDHFKMAEALWCCPCDIKATSILYGTNANTDSYMDYNVAVVYVSLHKLFCCDAW